MIEWPAGVSLVERHLTVLLDQLPRWHRSLAPMRPVDIDAQRHGTDRSWVAETAAGTDGATDSPPDAPALLDPDSLAPDGCPLSVVTADESSPSTVASDSSRNAVEDGPPDASAVDASAPSAERPLFAGLAGLVEDGAAELDRVCDRQRVIRRAEADRTRALAAFARSRPAGSFDRAPGEVGAASAASRAARPAALTQVSEWAVDEVAVRLRLTAPAAQALLVTSVVLDEQLPTTLTALGEGRIGWEHAQVLAEILPLLTDPAVRARVEARLLARVGCKTRPQLREAAVRAVTRADAEAAARRAAAALREREVRLFPGRDGLGALHATLPLPVARACYDALERYAEACRTEGDQRSKGQRMTDCLTDLILRPGESGLAPVQAQLTVVAPAATLLGGNEPGEVDGDLIPAEMVRELAHALGLMPRPTDEAPTGETTTHETTTHETTTHETTTHETTTHETPAHETPAPSSHETAHGADSDAGESGTTADETRRGAASADEAHAGEAAEDAASADETDREEAEGAGGEGRPGGATDDSGPRGEAGAAAAETERRRAALGDLLATRRIAGTGLAELPRIAVVDALTGALLALTDATALRAGRPLGPPPETPGYRPRDALDRFVRLRDRRCRFPGCRARPRTCDLDHQIPYGAGGRTTHCNLCCLCEHHHRLSHQAPGWAMHPMPDGGIRWTLPGGTQALTHPPAYGTDDDLPPEGEDGSESRPTGARHPAVSSGADDTPPF